MGLRIIGGDLKRKNIRSVEGPNTRPTTDRVRESLFNILSNRVQNKIVLDLFAGTGALGIESLSRGAASCVFIDKNKKSIQTIKNNIISCNLNEKTRTIIWDLKINLNCLKSSPFQFDLIFLDPPYNFDFITPTLKNMHEAACLKNDALLIIEHSIAEPIDESLPNFELNDQRKYGKTNISFLTYAL